jgi:hypothetical protein
MTEPGRDVYSWLAQKVFPDAFIVGATGLFTVKLAPIVNIVRTAVSCYLNISLPPLSNVSGFYAEGFEVLMSVSSAQFTVFHIRGGGLELQTLTPPVANLGFTVYKGYVWNLWNDDDYTEWFTGFNIGGLAIFWDKDDMFKGPWGVGRPIIARSAIQSEYGMMVGVGGMYYEIWDPNDYSIECELIPIIYLAEFFDLVVRAGPITDPAKLGHLLFRFSVWAQAGTAKMIWNRREGFTVEERQSKERPPRYHSGPNMPIFY